MSNYVLGITLTGGHFVRSEAMPMPAINSLVHRIQCGLSDKTKAQTIPIPDGRGSSEHVVIPNIVTFYTTEQAGADLPPF